jgi:hypothetical protein
LIVRIVVSEVVVIIRETLIRVVVVVSGKVENGKVRTIRGGRSS